MNQDQAEAEIHSIETKIAKSIQLTEEAESALNWHEAFAHGLIIASVVIFIEEARWVASSIAIQRGADAVIAHMYGLRAAAAAFLVVLALSGLYLARNKGKLRSARKLIESSTVDTRQLRRKLKTRGV